MTLEEKRRRADRLMQAAITFIGLHSILLGAAMLLFPTPMLGLLGFPPATDPFFPSQSGIFLLILGAFYLRALVRPAYVELILCSKAVAVVFLLSSALVRPTPPLIWAAAAGDFSMLVATGALAIHRRSIGGADML